MLSRREGREITPCPACGLTRFHKRFTKKGRHFWRCTTCGLEQQYPLPSLDELRTYYDSSYRSGMYKVFADAEHMKSLTARHRFEKVAPHAQPGRWLDVGCSNGTFIAFARRQGLSAEGIDLSEEAVRAAREQGLPAYQSTVDRFDPGYRYENITCFDVLEHVLDPLAFLASVRGLLAPGGVLALTVPDQGSLMRKLMGARWYFYIPEEHLFYFNATTIKAVLARAGFVVERCAPVGKPLTLRYSLTQFQEYNPLIYRALRAASAALPGSLMERTLLLYIGELMVIARRADEAAVATMGGLAGFNGNRPEV